MKKNRILVALICLLSTGILISQQLTPFVVSTSGGFYDNNAGMLSFTTGEMTAVETFNSQGSILTQGFQQPWDFETSINGDPYSHFAIGIYPNPSNGNFKLVTESDSDENITVKIVDVLGREIFRKEFYHQGKINVQPFDLSGAAQGIYLVSVIVKENDLSQQYHFIKKIHIVK